MWLSREPGSGPSTNMDMPDSWAAVRMRAAVRVWVWKELASLPSDPSRLPYLGPLLPCLSQARATGLLDHDRRYCVEAPVKVLD